MNVNLSVVHVKGCFQIILIDGKTIKLFLSVEEILVCKSGVPNKVDSYCLTVCNHRIH